MEVMVGFRYLYGLIYSNIPLLIEPCMNIELFIAFLYHKLHKVIWLL